VAEMFLERGFVFTHETVRDWESRFAPLIVDQLRKRQRGQAGSSWHVDETFVRVHRKWGSLYRAIDLDSSLVDSMLSEKRNMEVAKRFFQQAIDVVGPAPKQVMTDSHTSLRREAERNERIGQISHDVMRSSGATTVLYEQLAALQLLMQMAS
jgi:putative transposase